MVKVSGKALAAHDCRQFTFPVEAASDCRRLRLQPSQKVF